MIPITFIDTEIDPNNGNIRDIGCIKSDGCIFHENSVRTFIDFLKGSKFICGHNILNHDIKYIGIYLTDSGISQSNIIDTLFLSPLLFPKRPYHHLVKDEKLQTDELSNPVSDSIKAKDLFYDEVNTFNFLELPIKQIFYLLLKDTVEFRAFFNYISFEYNHPTELLSLIRTQFNSIICNNIDLQPIINNHPVALAYTLSNIHCNDPSSITPPWVLKNFAEVDRIIFLLKDNPCLKGCDYCNKALDPILGLQRYFKFSAFRLYAGEPLQANAVKAAIDNKSLLAVFPTGGGKSITFQLPALMSGENTKGLTVVISPLQSLMKDQVDNLEKSNITFAVTINGLLDPIERSNSFERVENGSALILYISPELLRSRSIERLLLGRKINRFVIDEAHCFSAWGQDFRVDYLYIGDFIKSLQEKKNLQHSIPVSCFTATAKQKVIEDICIYFKDKLSLNLEIFRSKASRTNLHYKVFKSTDEEDKYNTTRNLIESKNCPCILYVSRTRKASILAERLKSDGFNALPYHGKMDAKDKTANQNAFISGDVQIMVATSAFGMGVDKKDVGLVIHYDISDSLENYIQEAGRAGRDENITADCFVIFDEQDLGKHFILLNQTKLNLKEIQQIWKAIKDLTRFRLKVSNSALEIARKAGWDERISEIETRVTTAIAALEDAGYVKRGQNIPKIYASSILTKTAQEAIDKINSSQKFDNKQKDKAIRIIKKLISSKSRKQSNEEVAESRVDYISDHLGIEKGDVINIITLLREEKILADTKDLTAFIKKGENKNRSLSIANSYRLIEECLLPIMEGQEKIVNLKELNELAQSKGCIEASPNKIKTILNYWFIKNWIKRQYHNYSKNHISIICTQSKAILNDKQEKRHYLAQFIVEYLYWKASGNDSGDDKSEEIIVEFSVHELKDEEAKKIQLFKYNISINDIEDTLFYLSRIEAIKIEGGFLVVHNSLTLERSEHNNKIQYKNEDYKKLQLFYQNKIQQIHIVGEYAKKMVDDYKGALQFVEDYFQLNYPSFLVKYFPGSREDEINQNLTPAKFKKLFGELSPSQLKIINDKQSKYMVVAAGPGSGKTKVLVHKLASLILLEDVKYEQLLMLTFSRAAATEFKKRLIDLIGNAANFIEIKTFHSFCFDLLGKVGSIEKSEGIITSAIKKIRNADVEPGRITKSVLVIDEAQDMDSEEYGLICALIEQNEEMRVIAVGDDDQNIFTFRGADSKYMEQLIVEKNAIKYELIENYRSKSNLVSFSNQFVAQIQHRLKALPIVAQQQDDGLISLNHHESENMVLPLVNDIVAGLSGSTGVLTKTNDEAMQITGILNKKGLPAKLIQNHDDFNLYNLLEIRFFINELNLKNDSPVIYDEDWENAKQLVSQEFKQSNKIDICLNLIRDFEITNTKKKYKSDLEVFIKESKIEDFGSGNSETVLVSTIHKAKGKEFDNVFLMLENLGTTTDDLLRQLYVAITRAKQNLSIHHNSNYFTDLQADSLTKNEMYGYYPPLNSLIFQLTLKDVQLWFFEYNAHLLKTLRSGDVLLVNNVGCTNIKGQLILKFSSHFQAILSPYELKGYKLKEARVNFMVYWKNLETEKELLIILPEICIEK